MLAESEFILFFPNTYSVQKYRDLEIAKSRYPGADGFKRDMVKSPRDLASRYSLASMRRFMADLTTRPRQEDVSARDRATGRVPRHNPHCPNSTASALLEVLEEVAQPIEKKVSFRRTKDVWTFDLAKINSLGPNEMKSYTKQARVLIEEIRRFQVPDAGEEELMVRIRELGKRGTLKTRQDPWRIMQFYAGRLHEDGLLTYPGRRKRDEEDDPDSGDSAGET